MEIRGAGSTINKLVEQHPSYRSAVATVAERAETGELSADWQAVSAALKKLGVADSDASSLALEISHRALITRYDPDGALRAKGLPEAEIAKIGKIALRHATAPKADRLQHLARSTPDIAGLRVDVELVQKRDSLTRGSSALGRRTMARQADMAALRLRALAKALDVDLADLMHTVGRTVIDGKRADQLIETQFSQYLPAGTVFDRTQGRVQLVSPEVYANETNSWLGQAVAKLLKQDPRVPYELPRLERNGRVLIAATHTHFGNGGMVPLGLREYAHPQLVAALGGDPGAASLAQGLAFYLAEWVNEQFDPERAKRQLADAAAVGVKGRPPVSWAAVDYALPGRRVWLSIAAAVGYDAVAEGFFQDPARLRTQIEELVGATGYRQIVDALAQEERGRLSLSALEGIVDGLFEKAAAREKILPGVLADIDLKKAATWEKLVTAVADKLKTTPAAAAEVLAAGCDLVPNDKRAALAAAVIETLGDAGMNGLPAPAFATLGALIYDDGKLFASLAAHAADHAGWIYARHDRLPEQLAAGASRSAQRTFERSLAWRGAQAIAELQNGLALPPGAAKGYLAEVRNAATKGLQQVLEPYLAADKLDAVMQTLRDAHSVDMKHDSTFAWAEIVSSGAANTRASHLALGGTTPWACVLETGDPTPYVELALHSARDHKVAAVLGDDIASALLKEVANGLGSLTTDRTVADGIRGYSGSSPGLVPDQVIYCFGLALERAAHQASPTATDEQVKRAVTEQLLRVALHGRLDVLRSAVDAVSGAGAFDALCASLKTVPRSPDGLEALRPQLKKIHA
ncbi:MAG: hypothetical protein HY903_00580 [Deltaproteobacteria bacterium]|nr:hypothetical protein [Deltaproteobacteria bacterium]